MDRKTHKLFAPIFTFGVTYIGTKSGILTTSTGMGMLLTSIVPTIVSNFTAMVPDADHHAYRPLNFIWANKTIIYRDKRGNPKRYNPPKKKSTKYIATFFKTTGVTCHRHFMSHSPFIWLLYSAILCIPLYFLKKLSGTGLIYDILKYVIMGGMLGIFSHLIGDMFTLNGLPLLPDKDFKPMRMIFGKIPILRKLPKADNKIWHTIFIGGSIYLVLFIVFPEKIAAINKILFSGIIKDNGNSNVLGNLIIEGPAKLLEFIKNLLKSILNLK